MNNNNYQAVKLSSRVKAVNAANANAIALYKAFSVVAEKFIGQKIFKADGDLTAKFKAALPNLPFFFYKYNSGYSLVFVTKECVSYGEGFSGCVYEEASSYVAQIEHGVLMKLYDAPNLRTDFTAEEILSLRKQAEDAKELARQAESKLCGFGLYDR
jgi:hypothetical protein